MAPHPLNKVYFTCGGSEANESAIKLAKQYHKDAGNKEKHIVIGRWHSYHGNTLGSLSAGGDIKRRQLYTQNLLNFKHVYSPNCIRCPYQRKLEDCNQEQNWSCVKDIEKLIIEVGPEQISSFIAEPIVGSQLGSVSPPNDYFKKVRELCDQYNIILIADEVMTGFGRTGTHFAIEHFDFIPDIITFGKGVSAGYSPLGGMIVHDKLIAGLIQNSQGKFAHGYTYSGHPVSVAAGLAVVKKLEENQVLENVKKQGEYLYKQLKRLQEKYTLIWDVRGKGLLLGIELAINKSGDPFPVSVSASEEINRLAMEHGAVFYPGKGTINGLEGDHLLIAPPLIISKSEIDKIIHILEKALQQFMYTRGMDENEPFRKRN